MMLSLIVVMSLVKHQLPLNVLRAALVNNCAHQSQLQANFANLCMENA